MTALRALLAVVLTMAAATASAADDPYAGIRSVAIVSSLGDGLTMKRGADFSSDPDVVLNTGAGIDSYITAQIRDAVAGRFTVVSQTQSPDALIVVHPSQIAQHLFLPPLSMTFRYNGLSATRTDGWFGRHSVLLSAQYTISVVDAKTGAPATLPATGMFGARPDPIERCDDPFWPADLAAPSSTELEQLRADVMAIIAAALPNALLNAGLSAGGNDVKPTQWNGHALSCQEFG
jgi:hypothetical protein